MLVVSVWVREFKAQHPQRKKLGMIACACNSNTYEAGTVHTEANYLASLAY